MSRGVRTSVLPGGQGFECPPNYGMFFDTAAEALNHAAAGRVYDDEGRTPCLWAGCGRMFSSTQVHHGKWLNGNDLKKLLQHEKQHVKGDPAAFTGFRCPEATRRPSRASAAQRPAAPSPTRRARPSGRTRPRRTAASTRGAAAYGPSAVCTFGTASSPHGTHLM